MQANPNQMNRRNEMPPAPNQNFVPDRNKAPISGSNNMYKLSRGKGMKMPNDGSKIEWWPNRCKLCLKFLGMKANYVNVLSQSTTPSTANVPPPGAMMDYTKTQVPPNMKLFVPSSGMYSACRRGVEIFRWFCWIFLCADGPSSMPGDMQSSKLPDNAPLFFNPAQYNS